MHAQRASRALRGACELTEAGRRELASLPARAVRARALRDRLLRELVLDAASLDALPPHDRKILREWRTRGLLAPAHTPPPRSSTRLNAAQSEAASAIVASLGAYAAFMLNGVTGSGKTEVYLAAADAVLASRSARC